MKRSTANSGLPLESSPLHNTTHEVEQSLSPATCGGEGGRRPGEAQPPLIIPSRLRYQVEATRKVSPIKCDSGAKTYLRRDFLKLSGLAASGLAFAKLPAMAGPFSASEFEKLVPIDKKLAPAWVKSLFERGVPLEYQWPDSQKIGMPIGGICAGQVYLGGDGKLWHWDIFNRHIGTGAEHYANPLKPQSPFEQGFALRLTVNGKTETRALDHTGFGKIVFRGEYPIGRVEYADPNLPATVRLEAFSPFIPLNTQDSSLPATIMRFTVKNTSQTPVIAELAGWLENAVCLYTAQAGAGQRRNRLMRKAGLTFLECSAESFPAKARPAARPDIRFEDFEKPTYMNWSAEGNAFGGGPIEQTKIPDYQGDVGGQGKRVVNSHATAPGSSVGEKDSHTGALTSERFKVERHFINFLVGGGSHQGKTCMNLLVGDQVVLSATGRNDNRMKPQSFDVRHWEGRDARLQIVDNESGGWGNIGIDEIVFSDHPAEPETPLTERYDFGTMGLALLDDGRLTAHDTVHAALPNSSIPHGIFSEPVADSTENATQSFGKSLMGSLGRKWSLAPDESRTITFLVTWHFPNLKLPRGLGGRHYATRFKTALGVAAYVAENFEKLAAQTRLWRDTWYDSTLPFWFLDRAFAPVSHLASSTCHWLANGRFYGWEGVGCCEGTCTHVWHYAHAVARLFPELERSAREMADFGVAFDWDTGSIGFRGEAHKHPAIDGQAGCILRVYREHQMSANDAFLRRNWPKVKRALEFLITADADNNGILEGRQHNTLDADWYGPVAWLSGLYLAALLAGEAMARETGDLAFAERCRNLAENGRRQIGQQLWNGEYFINQPDPKHLDAINSGTGCHIDQVFGQSWAFQVGLGRVFNHDQARAALNALWKYNFTPDVGPWRQANQPGRWYAMPGEGGLIMCTFPQADWDYGRAAGKGPNWAAGYFNECMNGFEYQAAGHMIWEGLLLEGLAITRMVHDRYHAVRRNPWNEVECGDHYARSLAGYGVYLAACGFECHGPQGHLGFAPRLTPNDFRCAFTAAEGWGSFSQKSAGRKQTAEIEVKWGTLRLRTLALQSIASAKPVRVSVDLGDKSLPARLEVNEDRVQIRLEDDILLTPAARLLVVLE